MHAVGIEREKRTHEETLYVKVKFAFLLVQFQKLSRINNHPLSLENPFLHCKDAAVA